MAEPAKITVSPTNIEMVENQKRTLSVLVEGDYTVTRSEFLHYDKTRKELTALKPTESPVTMSFTKDDETVTIQVKVSPFIQDTGLILQRKDYQNKTNITEGYFGDVRLIEDAKDFVAAENTNRPHLDTIDNLKLLSSIEDVRGLHSSGEWEVSEIYHKGCIVAFLSEYFISLKDNNTGNLPKLSSEKDKDEYWKPICNITDVGVKDFSPKGRESMETGDFYPFINGKNPTKVTLKAGRTYTVYRMPRLLPFKEDFSMYLIFRGGNFKDSAYPYISFVECSVNYTGLKNNSNDLLVPELRFGSCNTSIQRRNTVLDYPQDTDTHGYDKYGPYGVSMQSCMRKDEMVSITLSTKWDCDILFTGDYRMSPSAIDETGSLGAVPSYSVNHLVRPHGGDAAQDLGSLALYFNKMSAKQIWDRGLLNRMEAREVYSTEYTLLAHALGFILNAGDTKPEGSDYNNTGAEMKFNLPKIEKISEGNIIYTRAF